MFTRKKSAFGKLRELIEEELERSTIADPSLPHISPAPKGYHKEWIRCAGDVAYWVNTYCHTYDPRTEGKSLPFHLYPRQVEFFRWLTDRERLRESGICEKSRGVGVSFLCAAYALHGWLFKPGYKVGFGSRKLEYVDALGVMDSLFEKIRFMLRRLPNWMYPPRFRQKNHDCYTKLINPDTGAAITGEGGDNIGRGGRCSIYFVDEAAFLERPHQTEASLVETTDVRIDVSTANGPGNPFATKRYSLPPHRVFTFHWLDDPRKNQYVVSCNGTVIGIGQGRPDGNDTLDGCTVLYPWAEKTKREKGLVVFAGEYDIDYGASVEGITIPGAWVRAAVGLNLYGVYNREGHNGYANGSLDTADTADKYNGSDIRHFINRPDIASRQRNNVAASTDGTENYYALPDGRLAVSRRCTAGLDIGEEGNDLSVFIPRWGSVIGMPVSWGKTNTTQTAFRAREEAIKHHVSEVCYDSVGVGAGVKGTLRSMDTAESHQREDIVKALSMVARPINTGVPPTLNMWPDGQTSKEKFVNLKAELWWALRLRFEKTYEYVTQGIQHPAEEMISIPNCPQLIADLSLPLNDRNESGKIKIESKNSMRLRGVKSPDFAEALVMSEACLVVKKQTFWVR